MNIHYINGDATRPRGDGKKIICHICNDKGRWGAGFVLALSARWSDPEESYRNMPPETRTLGSVMFVPVENDIVVANMIGQHDTCPDENGQPPIRYNAVRAALKGVNELATQIDATIHMPRIGCGLAGASWDLILPIIEETCTVNVYVYDLK